MDEPTTPNFLSAACPSRSVFALLADKWTLLVIAAITRGVNRNGALLREIGDISQKMLTQTLRELEVNGIIQRQVFEVVPPRVEYQITPLGETLIQPIHMLGRWAEEHYPQVEAARSHHESDWVLEGNSHG
jgi:DNA-binding HxlR family transcriptional regulator